MKNNNLIKHPNGLAVDIGVNKSNLSETDGDRVIDALHSKGLYVLDERKQQNPCIHVSRTKDGGTDDEERIWTDPSWFHAKLDAFHSQVNPLWRIL